MKSRMAWPTAHRSQSSTPDRTRVATTSWTVSLSAPRHFGQTRCSTWAGFMNADPWRRTAGVARRTPHEPDCRPAPVDPPQSFDDQVSVHEHAKIRCHVVLHVQAQHDRHVVRMEPRETVFQQQIPADVSPQEPADDEK